MQSVAGLRTDGFGHFIQLLLGTTDEDDGKASASELRRKTCTQNSIYDKMSGIAHVMCTQGRLIHWIIINIKNQKHYMNHSSETLMKTCTALSGAS